MRDDVQEIFRMNKVGDRWSNMRTENYKWVCCKMTNIGGNNKTEKWDWILSHQILIPETFWADRSRNKICSSLHEYLVLVFNKHFTEYAGLVNILT